MREIMRSGEKTDESVFGKTCGMPTPPHVTMAAPFFALLA
jgi:hypothetical protein